MLILALDTATRVCSVALWKGDTGDMVAEYTQNIKKTHSQRLLPLVDQVLTDTATDKSHIEAIAVAAGPGSFTGLRIGVSTARALAQGLKVPAVGVSTLEALAGNLSTVRNELICPLLDARRDQVYSALYRYDTAHPGQQCKDESKCTLKNILSPRALSINDLLSIINQYQERVYFPGDGLFKYAPFLQEELGNRFAEIPSHLALNRASAVARCAAEKLLHAEYPLQEEYSLYDLQPYYLRLPEAERKYRQQSHQHEA